MTDIEIQEIINKYNQAGLTQRDINTLEQLSYTNLYKMERLPPKNIKEMSDFSTDLAIKNQGWLKEKDPDIRREHGFDFISMSLNLVKLKFGSRIEYPELDRWTQMQRTIRTKTMLLGSSGDREYKRMVNTINALQSELIGEIRIALYQMGLIIDVPVEEEIRLEGPERKRLPELEE